MVRMGVSFTPPLPLPTCDTNKPKSRQSLSLSELHREKQQVKDSSLPASGSFKITVIAKAMGVRASWFKPCLWSQWGW